jgi:parallel beta-helix repeat protein
MTALDSTEETHAMKTAIRIAALALGSAAWLGALAGQLEPPGPVGPTDRVTLNGQATQPPFTITKPGSYVLTSDIRDCIPCDDLPTDGIIIAASDVTLDLNGFAVVGAPLNSLSGIVVQPGQTNVVVRNGVVRDWAVHGIDASAGQSVHVEGLRASDNGGSGIVVGLGGIVRASTASGNGGQGIVAAPGSVITECAATGNGADGLVATPTAVPSGSTISDSSARANGGSGILAGDGTTISGCSSSQNGAHGISTGLGCTIRSNTATTNAADGIRAFDSLVQGNTASFNSGSNINAAGSTVIENHVGP